MCPSVTGLRGVAALLLVGLTFFLASTMFGGDGGSSVRHFFTGKQHQLDNQYATCPTCMVLRWSKPRLNMLLFFPGASEEPTAGQ